MPADEVALRAEAVARLGDDGDFHGTPTRLAAAERSAPSAVAPHHAGCSACASAAVRAVTHPPRASGRNSTTSR